MKTTKDYLDAISQRHGEMSDYAIAESLGVTRSCTSRYRISSGQFDDLTAIRTAELLDIAPLEMIVEIHATRAKNTAEKAVWASILERLGGPAAALLRAFGLASTDAPAFDNNQDTLCLYWVPGIPRLTSP